MYSYGIHAHNNQTPRYIPVSITLSQSFTPFLTSHTHSITSIHRPDKKEGTCIRPGGYPPALPLYLPPTPGPCTVWIKTCIHTRSPHPSYMINYHYTAGRPTHLPKRKNQAQHNIILMYTIRLVMAHPLAYFIHVDVHCYHLYAICLRCMVCHVVVFSRLLCPISITNECWFTEWILKCI